MPLLISNRASIGEGVDKLLSQWRWLLPILLAAFALALRDGDVYPPAEDEFYSMNNAGWLVERAYSPGEIADSLRRNSPNHTPLYFLLLSLWGNLTVPDIHMARILGCLLYLPLLGVIYRLGADFVAKPAGLFAVLIAASNAFFNYYIAFARMYVLLLLLAGITLWLYLRLVYQTPKVRRVDFAALALSSFCLLYTSLVSVPFLATLGIFHLFIARKDRRWLWICAAFALSLLLFLPQLLSMLPFRFTGQVGMSDWIPLNGMEAARAWLTATLNDMPLLLLISGAGLALGWRHGPTEKRWLLLPGVFLVLFFALAQATDLVAPDTMRYHLADWLPALLLMAAGVWGAYRFRRWLGLLLLAVWLFAGHQFENNARWYDWLGGRSFTYNRQPIHAISRLAAADSHTPAIIGYGFDSFWLDWKPFTELSQRDHYFATHGIPVAEPDDKAEFHDIARRFAVVSPRLWLVFHPRHADAATQERFADAMRGLNYALCNSREIGKGTVILDYSWKTINCAPPRAALRNQNAALEYDFIAAQVDGESIIINDGFRAKAGVTTKDYRLSYQLLASDWNNVAQLDLSLTKPAEARMFTLDTADVAPGRYRLVAIVYNRYTNERLLWQDGSHMLPLREIELPS